MLKSKGIEALKDLSSLVWVGAVVLARGPSQQVGPVIAPADLHVRVCSHDSLQRLLPFGLLEGCLNPVPGGSVSKKKTGRDDVCLVTWSRSLCVVTNCSDWGNGDSAELSEESKFD